MAFDLTQKEAKLLWYACKCIVNTSGLDEEIKAAQEMQGRLYAIAYPNQD